jgi:hypothetical protein
VGVKVSMTRGVGVASRSFPRLGIGRLGPGVEKAGLRREVCDEKSVAAVEWGSISLRKRKTSEAEEALQNMIDHSG